MDLTPEERQRIYREEKAKLEAQRRGAWHSIRYWSVTLIVVLVFSTVVDTFLEQEKKKAYQAAYRSYKQSLTDVSLRHIASVYFGFLEDPQAELRRSSQSDLEHCEEWLKPFIGRRHLLNMKQLCQPPRTTPRIIREKAAEFGHLRWARPLVGLVFTTATIASDGWLSVTLLALAIVFSIGTLVFVSVKEDSEPTFGVVVCVVPLLTWVFLFALFAFAWLGSWIFNPDFPLTRFLFSLAGIPVIGRITFKVCEHLATEKTIHKLAA
jgi:hypothetical protein